MAAVTGTAVGMTIETGDDISRSSVSGNDGLDTAGTVFDCIYFPGRIMADLTDIGVGNRQIMTGLDICPVLGLTVMTANSRTTLTG